MKKVLLVFWPENGNVEKVADKIVKKAKGFDIEKISIQQLDVATLEKYDNWIVGGSTVGAHTWQDADDSNRWFEYFKMLNSVDLTSKWVSFYGLGDQILYPHHFVDELGIFQEEFEKRNANIVGQWPAEGYNFSDSDGMEDGMFYGLAIDEDHQQEMTDQRIGKWLEMLEKAFK